MSFQGSNSQANQSKSDLTGGQSSGNRGPVVTVSAGSGEATSTLSDGLKGNMHLWLGLGAAVLVGVLWYMRRKGHA